MSIEYWRKWEHPDFTKRRHQRGNVYNFLTFEGKSAEREMRDERLDLLKI